MSKIPMLIVTILFAVCVSFPQQPATGDANTTDPTKAAEQEQAEKDFRENRTAFLNDTLVDLQNLRTRENRIFFSSEIASVMWKDDEVRARSLFANAAGELIEVIRQTDQALTAARTNGQQETSYGFWGDPPDSYLLRRKLSAAMAVRRGLASSIMDVDPDLAFSFFIDSRDVISDPELKAATKNLDGYFEGQMLAGLVRSNVKKAADLGKRSVKDGVNYSHIELLRSIYAKDPEKGAEFASAILSSLKDHEAPVHVTVQLLSMAGRAMEEAKKTGKPPMFTDGGIRELAEIMARGVLDKETDEGTASIVASTIQKYLPSRAVQIRAKYKLASPSDPGNGENYTYSEPVSSPMNESGTGSGTGTAVADKKPSAQEEQANAIRNVMTLGTKKLSDEERQKIVADARRIISGSNDRSQKIIGLGMLATQVAKFGDKDLAAQIMRDAEAFVDPQPRNARDFLCSWMLVSGYAETDPEKAFRILDDLIYRTNDLINAAVKVGEFVDVNQGIFVDGEVQVGDFGSSMIRGMTGTLTMGIGPLRTLAKADFKRTAGLTDRIQRPEARILAKMLFLRAVYQDGISPAGQAADEQAVEEALK